MLELFEHVLVHAVIDSLKLLPFLFLAYLLIEYIEHRASDRFQQLLNGSGKFGPLGGALVGLIPQCGFSGAAANLYSCRVITAGTLIAVFLSTSDEAIPVLLSNPEQIGSVGALLLAKVLIAVIAGFLLDLTGLFRSSQTEKTTEAIHHLCDDDHCGCETGHGIFRSALNHTIRIFLFVLLLTILLNLGIELIGEEQLSNLLMSNTVFQPAIAALIGLIPNCAASVLITQLYVAGTISFGSAIAGLCTGAGVGLIVLFKSNHNLKQNLKLLLYLYLAGAIFGTIIHLLGW